MSWLLPIHSSACPATKVAKYYGIKYYLMKKWLLGASATVLQHGVEVLFSLYPMAHFMHGSALKTKAKKVCFEGSSLHAGKKFFAHTTSLGRGFNAGLKRPTQTDSQKRVEIVDVLLV